MPPRIKVLEALGSIADGRVHVNDHEATVISSTGERKYTVIYDEQRNAAYSDDNGTKFRGYVGYPIIALLMKLGKLPYDKRLAEALKGIPWKKLNERFKSYAKTEAYVKRIASEKGIKPDELDKFTTLVLQKLHEIGLEVLTDAKPSS